jgi:hypothetical protein
MNRKNIKLVKVQIKLKDFDIERINFSLVTIIIKFLDWSQQQDSKHKREILRKSFQNIMGSRFVFIFDIYFDLSS